MNAIIQQMLSFSLVSFRSIWTYLTDGNRRCCSGCLGIPGAFVGLRNSRQSSLLCQPSRTGGSRSLFPCLWLYGK